MKLSVDIKIAILFFLISFFGAIFQSLYIYDSFHWTILQSSIDFMSGKIPYKEFFVHYGFLHTLINSFGLYLSNNDLLSAMVIASLFFSLGNFILFLMSKKFLKVQYSIYIPILLFLLHPFANYPWPNYQFFFLICCSLFFYLNNNKLSLLYSGIFLSLACLTYENFIYISPVVFIFYLLLLKEKKSKNSRTHLMIGYLTPLILFHLYLYFFDLHHYWYKTFNLNSAFLKIYDTSILQLIVSFFYSFPKKAILTIFNSSYYFFFLIIFVSCLFFIFSIFFKILKKEKININERYLIIISVISILTLASAFHKINIFRFSTGPVIGILVLFYLISKYFENHKKYLISFFMLILISSSFIPIKQENNKHFPNFNQVNNSEKNLEINYFKSQKWNEETWNFLNSINNLTKTIKRDCKNIDHFVNYTTDGFIFMISKKYLKTKQYIYWQDSKKYYKVLNDHYNQNFDIIIDNSIKKENSIIFVSSNNLNSTISRLDLSNFKILNLPYTYEQKRVFIIFPAKCELKL